MEKLVGGFSLCRKFMRATVFGCADSGELAYLLNA